VEISVIIPVYNRFWEIKDAAESVTRQKRDGIRAEIIVVDDGSRPPMRDALIPYLPLITLINLPKNQGVSYARNIGAERAAGRYLAFLDSDDIFLPGKLARQLEVMKSGARASHTDEHWFKKDRFINQGAKHTRYGGEIFSKILDKCRISPSSFMIEKALFNELGGFDTNLPFLEDYEFFLRTASRVRIEYITEKLIIKRSITQNSLSAQITHIESARLDILKDFVTRHKLNPNDLAAAQREIERKKRIVKIPPKCAGKS
jgi:glycosyltransferase involved in cell wall biosynthesis